MDLHHCPSLSASASHLDDLSSDDDDRPPTPLDIWLTPGSASGTPRMKRRLHGSGHHQKKVDLMHKSPSRVTISQPPNRVRKDTEQQSEPPPAFKRKITWKNVHRWVEQTPEEPLPMIIFKWFMMIIGSVMVAAAIVIMLGVIHAGATGTLQKRNFLKNNSSMMTTMPTEDQFPDTSMATVDI